MNPDGIKTASSVESTDVRARDYPRGKRHVLSTLICRIVGEDIQGVLIRADEEGVGATNWTPSQTVPPRCRIISLVSRASYLVRVLEVPRAEPDETLQMLRLETKATLPREFGEMEMSYRLLHGSKPEMQRCEVYVVRRAELTAHLEILSRHGIEPDDIYPTAVLWVHYLQDAPATDVLAVAVGRNEWELASIDGDGRMVNRVIGIQKFGEVQNGLMEYLRPLLTQRRHEDPAMRVAWFGEGCPAAGNGRVVFHTMAAQEWDSGDGKVGLAPVMMIARSLFGSGRRQEELATANLLPLALQQRRQNAAAVRTMKFITGFTILGVILMGVALHVITVRHQAYSAEQNRRIATIRSEGEAVGRQLAQLEAIRGAHATKHNVERVLAGLYQGTPDQVSYNHVELNHENHLRLRGQAEVLSLPFILPQRLEALPMFQQVVLRDASQSRRGQGSIVEFHMEARLVPEGGKLP